MNMNIHIFSKKILAVFFCQLLSACVTVSPPNNANLTFDTALARDNGYALVAARVKNSDFVTAFRRINLSNETLTPNDDYLVFYDAKEPVVTKIPAGVYVLTHTVSDSIELPGGDDKRNILPQLLVGGIGALTLPSGRYYVHQLPNSMMRVDDGSSARGIEAFRFRVEPGEAIALGILDAELGKHGWLDDRVALETAVMQIPGIKGITFTFRPPTWTDQIP